MSSIAYSIATNFLALVFATSALAKLIQKPGARPLPAHWPTRISTRRWFPWTVLGMSAVMLGPVPILIQVIVAILLTTIVVSGQVLRLLHPAEECECFGSMTPTSKPVFLSACLVIVFASAYVTIVGMTSSQITPPYDWRISLGTIVLLGLIERKLRYDQTTGQGYARKWVDLSRLKSLPTDIVLGRDESNVLSTQDLANARAPSLILAISPHCGHCRDVYDLLVRLSETLSKALTIIVIAQNDDLYRANANAPIRQLIDPTSQLSRFLGLRARPYALYINGNLELQAPPSQSSETVQRLLAILLRAMQPAA